VPTAADDPQRLACPFCESRQALTRKVYLSGPGDAVIRRRECQECGGRYSTRETMVPGSAVRVRAGRIGGEG